MSGQLIGTRMKAYFDVLIQSYVMKARVKINFFANAKLAVYSEAGAKLAESAAIPASMVAQDIEIPFSSASEQEIYLRTVSGVMMVDRIYPCDAPAEISITSDDVVAVVINGGAPANTPIVDAPTLPGANTVAITVTA